MSNSVDYKWYFHVWKNYGDFEGRASCAEYWNFVLFNLLATVALGIISAGTLSIIYVIAVLIPSLAVTIRRLHDVGKSGWMLLISLVPIVGGIFLIVLLCMDSSDKGDTYGSTPLWPD